MSKLFRMLVITGIAFTGLIACNQQNTGSNNQSQTNTPAPPVAMPTDSKDTKAWKTYFQDVVTRNMEGVTTNTPYVYFVPSGDDQPIIDQRKNQLDNVISIIARGVLPGNMLAFGGPDSITTADLILGAFNGAQAGTLKGVRLLFIGKTEDSERVKAVVTPTGVDYRFVEMK